MYRPVGLKLPWAIMIGHGTQKFSAFAQYSENSFSCSPAARALPTLLCWSFYDVYGVESSYSSWEPLTRSTELRDETTDEARMIPSVRRSLTISRKPSMYKTRYLQAKEVYENLKAGGFSARR